MCTALVLGLPPLYKPQLLAVGAFSSGGLAVVLTLELHQEFQNWEQALQSLSP